MLNESTTLESRGIFMLMKKLMQDFKDVVVVECIYMGNSITTSVMDKGNILLKFTSNKLWSLSNVLYLPSLHRSSISAILLNKDGLKTIVGDNKFVISRNTVFVGKGYAKGNLFLLNIGSETREWKCF